MPLSIFLHKLWQLIGHHVAKIQRQNKYRNRTFYGHCDRKCTQLWRKAGQQTQQSFGQKQRQQNRCGKNEAVFKQFAQELQRNAYIDRDTVIQSNIVIMLPPTEN